MMMPVLITSNYDGESIKNECVHIAFMRILFTLAAYSQERTSVKQELSALPGQHLYLML